MHGIRHPIYSGETISFFNRLSKLNDDKAIFELIFKKNNKYLFFLIKPFLDHFFKNVKNRDILYTIIENLIKQFKILVNSILEKNILEKNINITIDNNFINNIFNLDESQLIKLLQMDNDTIKNNLGIELNDINNIIIELN